MIGLANSAEVDALWPQLSARFQEAIDRCGDDISIADLWQMCRSGNAFLMVAMEDDVPAMGAVLQFQKWEKGTVLRCLILAGEDMGRWFAELPAAVRKIAREGGATRFVFDGRDGWERVVMPLKIPKKLRTTYEVEI